LFLLLFNSTPPTDIFPLSLHDALPILLWIVLFAAFGGIASAAFAVAFLWVPEERSARILPHFVSFATGALLGAALLGLLPEAMRSEEHTSELQSRVDLVCRLLLEKKKQ